MVRDRATAEALAYSLGIAVHFDEKTGRISQCGPGVMIEPPKTARPAYDDRSYFGKDGSEV